MVTCPRPGCGRSEAQYVGPLVEATGRAWPWAPYRTVGHIFGCWHCRLAYVVTRQGVAAAGRRTEAGGDTPGPERNGASPTKQFSPKAEIHRNATNRTPDSDAAW